jgi:hypothetical protein
MWGRTTLDERFDQGRLDTSVWTDAYLPAWSSRAEAAATYVVDDDGLRLTIPPDQPLWCPELHPEPLRVSAIQSGNWSGPVGSPRGQQPFRKELRVREAQETHWGFTPWFSYVEVECRAMLTPRSKMSAWMVGLEDEPERCGEICIMEVFGVTVERDGPDGPSAMVGTGVHAFRDPRLVEEFSTQRLRIDVGVDHRYAVHWEPDRIAFLIDDALIRTVHQAPDYPMQLILGLFDFPARAPDPGATPELVVRRVATSPPVR